MGGARAAEGSAQAPFCLGLGRASGPPNPTPSPPQPCLQPFVHVGAVLVCLPHQSSLPQCSPRPRSMEENKRYLAALKRLLELPANRVCADCAGTDAGSRPTWASINTGGAGGRAGTDAGLRRAWLLLDLHSCPVGRVRPPDFTPTAWRAKPATCLNSSHLNAARSAPAPRLQASSSACAVRACTAGWACTCQRWAARREAVMKGFARELTLARGPASAAPVRPLASALPCAAVQLRLGACHADPGIALPGPAPCPCASNFLPEHLGPV